MAGSVKPSSERQPAPSGPGPTPSSLPVCSKALTDTAGIAGNTGKDKAKPSEGLCEWAGLWGEYFLFHGFESYIISYSVELHEKLERFSNEKDIYIPSNFPRSDKNKGFNLWGWV